MDKILDGRYELINPLGSGGFGKTYLARDQRIPGQPYCVVKQLHCSSRKAADIQLAQQLFQREAESLARLGHHDQIPRLLAYFNENDEFYLVEDYIEGQSLDLEIRNGQPWPEASVIQLLENLLDILTFVHSQNVIHRDIKPENLIRRPDGRIVLIDFGAIKQLEQTSIQGQHTGTQIGTMGYMPPEQAQGKPRPNSDIYGVGMVAIAALTGYPVMGLPDDPQTGEILWQQFAPHASPFLISILDKMVKYHFQNRFQTAQEALDALQASTTRPTSVASLQNTPPQSNTSPDTTSKKKGKSWILGLFLAIFIPIIGGAAALVLGPRPGLINNSGNNSGDENSNDSTIEPCKAIINGNIRSERTAYFGNGNILRSGQGQAFDIGQKETRGGWIEIRLPSGNKAWTHLDVVTNETDLKNCLRRQNIQLTSISDILPPPPKKPPVQPAPQSSPSPSPKPSETIQPEETEETKPPAETSPTSDDLLPEASEESTETKPPETAPEPDSTQSPQAAEKEGSDIIEETSPIETTAAESPE